MVTKEESLKALAYLENLEFEKDQCDAKSTVLNQLIFEHFDEKESKQPIEETRTYTTKEYKCPDCEMSVHEYGRYCSWCGRALDWTKQLEEEREKHNSVLWG